LGVRLIEQACNRIQNMVGQADEEVIKEALQQCERLMFMNQEMIKNSEQIGLEPEEHQMLQMVIAAQEGILNQVCNQFRIGNEDQADTSMQNQVQIQQSDSTADSGTNSTQSGSGSMESIQNSGDYIYDSNRFESPNGVNGNTYDRK